MIRRTLPLLLLLGACSETTANMRVDATEDDPYVSGVLRIDVYPPSDAEVRDDRGTLLDLRPQTFLVELEATQSVDLTMTPAVNVGGVIEGLRLTPWPSAETPSIPGTVRDAEVRFGMPGTVQQPRTTTDANGLFDLPVVPDSIGYDVSIVPSTPDLPFITRRIEVTDDTRTFDVFIDAGVPLWGTVSASNGAPLVGASVRALGDTGLRGPATTTDSQGRYLLIVEPEAAYTVLCEGRSPLDPTVRVTSPLVAAPGTRVDVAYGDLTLGGIVATVRGPSGLNVDDDAVRVSVIAESLQGFDVGVASHTFEVGTDRGLFSAPVPRGTYRVEIAPVSTTGPSPLRIDDVVVGGGFVNLGNVDLAPLAPRFGEVLDDEGVALGGATVSCTEDGFGGRTWQATTDPLGQFIINAPQASLTCTVTPPGTRPDLAITRQDIGEDLVNDGEARWQLQAVAGTVVAGRVRSRAVSRIDADPEIDLQGAVVEVRDTNDRLLGIGITDAEGRFSLRVVP